MHFAEFDLLYKVLIPVFLLMVLIQWRKKKHFLAHSLVDQEIMPSLKPSALRFLPRIFLALGLLGAGIALMVLHGDENGGLTTPQDFADFAEQCYEMGYRSFKVHGWGLARSNIRREVDNVLHLGKQFEGRMDLLIDPACEIKNFGDALRLGKACDEMPRR